MRNWRQLKKPSFKTLNSGQWQELYTNHTIYVTLHFADVVAEMRYMVPDAQDSILWSRKSTACYCIHGTVHTKQKPGYVARREENSSTDEQCFLITLLCTGPHEKTGPVEYPQPIKSKHPVNCMACRWKVASPWGPNTCWLWFPYNLPALRPRWSSGVKDSLFNQNGLAVRYIQEVHSHLRGLLGYFPAC